MNYSAGSIAARQKNERLIRAYESFDFTIFVYNASVPVRHKATIPHFLDLMLRSLCDVEFDWRLRGFFEGWLVVVIAQRRFSSFARPQN